DQVSLEKQLHDELAAAKSAKPPEHIQVVHALPRDAAGQPRTEILQLVAMNQLDLIEPMMKSEEDRAFLRDILDSRKNLRDSARSTRSRYIDSGALHASPLRRESILLAGPPQSSNRLFAHWAKGGVAIAARNW
ncbi:hypothetical protein KXW36_000930, partial [Aspergillus fumigatus]